jgi:hypothetical protein
VGADQGECVASEDKVERLAPSYLLEPEQDGRANVRDHVPVLQEPDAPMGAPEPLRRGLVHRKHVRRDLWTGRTETVRGRFSVDVSGTDSILMVLSPSD